MMICNQLNCKLIIIYVVIVVKLYMMKSKNLYPKTMPLLQRGCNVKNS